MKIIVKVASYLKFQVQRKFCILSAKRGMTQSGDKEKEKDFSQLAGPEAKVSPGILRSASTSAMTPSNFVQTPSKSSIVT